MTEGNPKLVKGHCPNCGPDRRADTVAQHRESWNDDDSGVWGEKRYRILRCRGCDEVYFQIGEVFSEDADYRRDPASGEWEEFLPEKITYWPAPSKRDQPQWAYELDDLDQDLGSLFDDIYVALNNDLRVLAAIGVRTAFDRASELLHVDPELSFGKKLEELHSQSLIGNEEKEALTVLTDAGSAAAHRGWKPKPSELEHMTSILEAFLHRSFIITQAAKALKESVPPRKRRST